jgi:hypothetical protein
MASSSPTQSTSEPIQTSQSANSPTSGEPIPIAEFPSQALGIAVFLVFLASTALVAHRKRNSAD